MSQEVYINFGWNPGDPLTLQQPEKYAGQEALSMESDSIEVTMVHQVGNEMPTVYFTFKLPHGRLAELPITARNLIALAGAVIGRLTVLGHLDAVNNPAIGFVSNPKEGIVWFTSETPLQKWKYDKENIKALINGLQSALTSLEG